MMALITIMGTVDSTISDPFMKPIWAICPPLASAAADWLILSPPINSST